MVINITTTEQTKIILTPMKSSWTKYPRSSTYLPVFIDENQNPGPFVLYKIELSSFD